MISNVIKPDIPGLLVIESKVFSDDRGSFFESYNLIDFQSFGINYDFKQDNQSISVKNVLRGLHFQNPPHEQGKLIRVAKGSVLDIAVDIRKDSFHYGKHFSIILSGKNNLILWIPPGFAHGFVTLEDTIFLYKCTNTYNKESEGALRWNDPDLNISWNVENPIVSDKDQVGIKFKDFRSSF